VTHARTTMCILTFSSVLQAPIIGG
jgi:hypothetical protein